MTSKELSIWQYEIRHVPHQGEWAVIFIREDGVFSAVSSYGNYAYWWSSTGYKDARHFFLRCKDDWDYFLRKLSPKTELNEEKSIDNIKRKILNYRRIGELDKQEARQLWDIIENHEDDWEGLTRDSNLTISYDDLSDSCVMEHSQNAVTFCKTILAKLSEIISYELEAEKADNQVEIKP